MKIKGKCIRLEDRLGIIKHLVVPESMEAEIDISAEELARQITFNDWMDLKSCIDTIKPPKAPPEPQYCECKEPKHQYNNLNVPDWCMGCGKLIKEPGCEHRDYFEGFDEGLKAGKDSHSKCDNECPFCEPEGEIEELNMPIIITDYGANWIIQLRDKVNELIRWTKREG